ncbi:MAG TPA: TIGR02996 domain-containing protein [Kofleriaceae bacterium]|nr:TIGR02996 domain-containing protein [Kofleriaceae bacterium]
MLGLQLVGPPRPVSAQAIADALGERGAVLPEAYVELMSTWGPGSLCSAIELPDPTSTRFRYLQHRLRVEGAVQRAAGAWGALAEDAFRGGVVLGVDRRGLACFARGAHDLVLLHPAGSVLGIGTFEELVAKFLLGGRLVATHKALFTDSVRQSWSWNSQHRADRAGRDLGVPALYVTDAPSPREPLIAAWTAGDEAAADLALPLVLEREVTGDAMLDLLHYLASPAAAAIPREIRAMYVDQLYRMASRRISELVPELPIREIRIALARDGALAPAQLAAIAAMIDEPAGIFIGAPDATEAALLEQIADAPADDAARLVYADHLEAHGELARADALRSGDTTAAPLPDAAQRGFIPPSSLAPVDGAGRVRARAEAWRREAPACAIEDLLAHIAALHPTARQGHEILLELQRQSRSFWQSQNYVAPFQHLVREIQGAWPQLALALRDEPFRASALGVLTRARAQQAAPFMLSCIRDPGPRAGADWLIALADAYVGLVKVKRALAAELAAHLADNGASPAMRAVAFRFCVDLGDDPRVFEAALQSFCEAHPFSEKILRRRKAEPRVREVLGAQLAAEEKTSLKDGGRRLAYSQELGLLARYLGKLGDPHAKELAERYRKFRRWADYSPREEM